VNGGIEIYETTYEREGVIDYIQNSCRILDEVGSRIANSHTLSI